MAVSRDSEPRGFPFGSNFLIRGHLVAGRVTCKTFHLFCVNTAELQALFFREYLTRGAYPRKWFSYFKSLTLSARAQSVPLSSHCRVTCRIFWKSCSTPCRQ